VSDAAGERGFAVPLLLKIPDPAYGRDYPASFPGRRQDPVEVEGMFIASRPECEYIGPLIKSLLMYSTFTCGAHKIRTSPAPASREDRLSGILRGGGDQHRGPRRSPLIGD